MTIQSAEYLEIKRRNAAAAHGNLRRWEHATSGYQRWWLERYQLHRIHALAAFVPNELIERRTRP